MKTNRLPITDEEQEANRQALARIILDTGAFDLADPKAEDELDAIHDNLRAWYCGQYGHEFVFDQCGYWQHKLCGMCGRPMYPDLAAMSCGKLEQLFQGLGEDAWMARESPLVALAKAAREEKS